MKILDDFCKYISDITTINQAFITVFFLSVINLIFFEVLKKVLTFFIKRKMTGRGEFIVNQSLMVIVNTLEFVSFLFIFGEYIKNMMTLISVVSAAMTIALRELILNFFCGIYLKVKRPFKVEDRIQINDIKSHKLGKCISLKQHILWHF